MQEMKSIWKTGFMFVERSSIIIENRIRLDQYGEDTMICDKFILGAFSKLRPYP